MHEIFQSQSVAPPTQQATYIPYCKVTLLHILSSNITTRVGKIVGEFLRNPQCYGNFSFDIDIAIIATSVLVINSYALNDTESHPNPMPLNYNAQTSGMNLYMCSSFLCYFFTIISNIVSENCGKMTTKGNEDHRFISSMSKQQVI